MDTYALLAQAIADMAQGEDAKGLLRAAQDISLRYRESGREGQPLLSQNVEAIAYAASRMPATYGALCAALREALQGVETAPRSLLDVGAGTGAGMWAAKSLCPLQEITCLEREAAMVHIGQTLARSGPPALQGAKWKFFDLAAPLSMRADLVLCAFVLNELPAALRAAAARKLWAGTDSLLILVEPGTPQGFANLRAIREDLLAQGAYVAAPCPHQAACPMPDEDWCHFTCRVPRSRLHKQLKGGDAPYEDEKFAYIALSKRPCVPAQARVLRHPRIGKGHVELTLCTANGLQRRTVTKKQGDIYKRARKAGAGDALTSS